MLKSLQVLRIHLLELEKVNELCKDFCTRYISCLKGKLNSDNIMRTLDISNTPPGSPDRTSVPSTPTGNFDGSSRIQMSPLDHLYTPDQTIPDEDTSTSSVAESHSRNLSTSFQPLETDKIPTNVSHSLCIDSNNIIPGNVNGMSVADLTSGFLSKKSKGGKRGVLPKQATNVLKGWLFQHLVVCLQPKSISQCFVFDTLFLLVFLFFRFDKAY